MDLTTAIPVVAVGVSLLAIGMWAIGARLRRLQSSIEAADRRLADAFLMVQQVTGESRSTQEDTIGRLNTQIGHISSATDDLLNETRRLTQALSAPGPRGGLGEVLLENLLRDALPEDAVTLQHSFLDGRRVDATVRVRDRIIPIDAKFPLTAFEAIVTAKDEKGREAARRRFTKDIRRHVDAVREYIRPEEQTVDYALMYIPGENIFHEIMRRDRGLDDGSQLWTYAHENRVIPTSPNTLFLYIQTIALALRGLSVERSARQIQTQLTSLSQDIRQTSSDVETLGSHLRNAQTKQQETSRRLSALQQKVEVPINLDRPE
ncbi:MAG: hypothetical protein CL790_01435 [Chloroflexi bacterium]|nr:hypothetical protein [Chloroflexota bacterium]HCU73313.1 hypothetical protein [Chloroflexota bacterium]|tara:strand:- start:4032 stop:4991 length:960 start_codon:yes stop_codon:yes gene_type:complete